MFLRMSLHFCAFRCVLLHSGGCHAISHERAVVSARTTCCNCFAATLSYIFLLVAHYLVLTCALSVSLGAVTRLPDLGRLEFLISVCAISEHV